MAIVRAISHVLAAVFSDASDFNRRWRDDDPALRAGGNIPHRWEGQWVSETNGHHGALRCLLTQSSPSGYEAKFHAVYARVLRVSYSVLLRGQPGAQSVALEGDSDLGSLAGGIYHYTGNVSEREFRCAYQCKYDRGTFAMFPVVTVKS